MLEVGLLVLQESDNWVAMEIIIKKADTWLFLSTLHIY